MLAVQTPEDPPKLCCHGAVDVMRYTEQQNSFPSANEEERQLTVEAAKPSHQYASRAASGTPALQSSTPDSEFVHRDGEPVLKQIRQEMSLTLKMPFMSTLQKPWAQQCSDKSL